MEAREMRRHIITRNLRLWGGSVVRAQGIYLLGTVVGTGTMYIFSSHNQPRGVYYGCIMFYFLMMELVGMLAQQFQYASKQYPMALAFGSGRMESVYGMQLSNAIFGTTSILFFSMIAIVGQTIEKEETGGFGTTAGTKILMYAEMVVLVLAFGQFMAASYLKNQERNTIYLLVVSAIIVVGAIVVFFEWDIFAFIGIVDEDKEINQTIARVTPMVIHGLGVLGVLLYFLGFSQMKKVVQEYEV